MTEKELIGKTVLKAMTTKMICYSCHRSFTTTKGAEYECGECEGCGNTSFTMVDGRPWGHKHRFWNDWIRSQWSLTEDNKITEDTLNIFDDLDSIGEYLVYA